MFVAQNLEETVRIVSDNSIYARNDQAPHLIRFVNRPGHYLQTCVMRLFHNLGSDEVASRH
jgi:hypothetical protein